MGEIYGSHVKRSIDEAIRTARENGQGKGTFTLSPEAWHAWVRDVDSMHYVWASHDDAIAYRGFHMIQNPGQFGAVVFTPDPEPTRWFGSPPPVER